MSYLSSATSKTDYGVVRIGNNINVEDGVISTANIIAGAGITVTTTNANITISAIGADFINTIGVTTNYTATLEDEYIGVSSANAITITLPTGVPGRVYYIKDEFGQGSGKITIAPQPGELIDNKTSYVIGIPYQAVSTVFRAGKWWMF